MDVGKFGNVNFRWLGIQMDKKDSRRHKPYDLINKKMVQIITKEEFSL